MLNFEQQPSSSRGRREVQKPAIVTPEIREELLKQPQRDRSRDRAESAVIEKRTGSVTRGRAESMLIENIPSAAAPEITHEGEKVQYRGRMKPAEIAEAKERDREREELLKEQIRNAPYLPQFETATKQSTWQADVGVARLLASVQNGSATVESIEAAKTQLIPLLNYLREQLQPYGLKMPPSHKVEQAMGAIHGSIVRIGEALYEADRYARNQQRVIERAGGRDALYSQDPSLRKSQELWGQHTEKAKADQKKKKQEKTGWKRFTSGLKSFFGVS